MYQVWLQSLDINSSYHQETKIWACFGQITPSKFDKICPLAIPNQISTVLMHIPSRLMFTQVNIRKRNTDEWLDGRTDWRTTDGRTDGQTLGRPTRNHNNPPLSCGGVYVKNDFLKDIERRVGLLRYSSKYQWLDALVDWWNTCSVPIKLIIIALTLGRLEQTV